MSNEKLNSYTGSKNGSGVYQKIISEMPPHSVYVELFLGSGAIVRRKRPAVHSFGVELDESLIVQWMRADYFGVKNFKLHHADALEYVNGWFVSANYWNFDPQSVLIYADPPYLESVRAAKNRDYYKHEFKTDIEHARLLSALRRLPCKVMISGYESKLYNDWLDGWRKIQIPTTNRGGGKVNEIVWMNFERAEKLHDYQFIGKNLTDRQRIKRKINNHVARLRRLDPRERNAILFAISEMEKQNN